MSKFQSTISVVAALASIFGAATAGWKLAQSSADVPPSFLDQKIEKLERKLNQSTSTIPIQSSELVVSTNDKKPLQTLQTEQVPAIEHKPPIEQKPEISQKPLVVIQQSQAIPSAPPAPQ